MGRAAIGVRVGTLGELPAQCSAQSAGVADDQLVNGSAWFRIFFDPAFAKNLGGNCSRFLVKASAMLRATKSLRPTVRPGLERLSAENTLRQPIRDGLFQTRRWNSAAFGARG